jgi:hypothetical protein
MPCSRLSATPKPVKITFSLPAEVEANDVGVCGHFSDWSYQREGPTRFSRIRISRCAGC